jgi:hypothetical protein
VRKPGLFFLAVVCSALAFAGDVRAASNDKEVEELLSAAASDLKAGKKNDALEKLEIASSACEGSGCSPKVRAKVMVGIGAVKAKKLPGEATQAFEAALKDDPAVSLGGFATPEATALFDEVKAAATKPTSKPKPEPEAKPEPETKPEPEAKPATEGKSAGARRAPKKKYEGEGKPGRGFKSAEASFYFDQAKLAEKAQEWGDCYDYAFASAQSEEKATTRALGGLCAERAGLWVEAIAELDAAAAAGNRTAAARSAELSQKVPKVVLRKPARTTSMQARIDGVEVPASKLEGEIWVNPGQRVVTVQGVSSGVAFEFEQVVDATEFETTTVEVKPTAKGSNDPAVSKCLLGAKSTEEISACFSKNSLASKLTWKVGSELSVYTDSDRVDVVTPAAFAGFENKSEGYGFNASFLVDVVTAASSDIIATASPRWTEVRYAPAVSGHKRFGDVDVGLRASASVEPDYLATNGGLSVSFELANKTITPSIGYDFSYDISGRSGTPFGVFSRHITRHAVDVSSTFVVNRSTFANLTFTGVFEDGDSSKPYRYIPLFSPEVADNVLPGQTVDSVNAARLPLRILEQLPTNRQRFALAGKIGHRFGTNTLRIEERLYIDSWGLKASTTDAKLLIDAGKRARFWPHMRFHIQDDVDFWRLAYPGVGSGSNYQVPALRTGDRELGTLLGADLGLGARFELTEKPGVALVLTADGIYTRFFETLFLINKFGFLGAATVEATF